MSNSVIIAAAGSRKTTYLVEECLRYPDAKTLILTYTIENYNQLKTYLIEKNGTIPKKVKVITWYSFLLSDCARPYQNFVYDQRRIENICFIQGISAKKIPKTNIEKFYFHKGCEIYTDKISQFACLCNDVSKGLMAKRLEKVYDRILIDEAQDLAGYDFDVLEILFDANIDVIVVGDCRQATYFTNCSPRYKKFKGKNITNLFKSWEQEQLCSIIEKCECYRCNQPICDFADKLYPDLPKTISKNNEVTGHDGIFSVTTDDVYDYYKNYEPIVLRDMIKRDTLRLPAKNFGISKGQTFDRILIFPNGPIKEYLAKGNPNKLASKTKANLYVGITRARYSVAFVYDKKTTFDEIQTY
jgi:DNA helicase-2/ATP-dependent DNA helicase PcrA